MYKEITTIYQQKEPKKITPHKCLAKKIRLVIIGLLGNQKPKLKYWVPGIEYPIIFGSDTGRHPSDLKFWVPKPKSLLVRIPKP